MEYRSVLYLQVVGNFSKINKTLQKLRKLDLS